MLSCRVFTRWRHCSSGGSWEPCRAASSTNISTTTSTNSPSDLTAAHPKLAACSSIASLSRLQPSSRRHTASSSAATTPNTKSHYPWSQMCEVHTHFVEKSAEGFLRNFFAGLLTTAGLSNIGPPCQDGDESFGLHGRVSNIPAEDVCISQGWHGDDYTIRLAGTVRQARTFGECLVLHREITTQLGSNALVVRDVVENAGSRPEPMMLLYHCNFGYPLVSADSRIYTSGGSVDPRVATPIEAVAHHDRLGEPQAGYVEQCFYHNLKAQDGRAFAAIFNERLGVGGYVRYRVENLPEFVQWKMLGEQEYVVGLEPSTHRLDRRAELIQQGQIRPLEAGERRTFEVEIGVVDGRAALEKLASAA